MPGTQPLSACFSSFSKTSQRNPPISKGKKKGGGTKGNELGLKNLRENTFDFNYY